jgi:hypothetical protein
MNTITRRLWTLLGFAVTVMVGGVLARPVTAAPRFRAPSPCIVSPDVPVGLDKFVRRVISTPDLAWFRTKTALLPVDTSLVAFSTDTLTCRLAAEAARRYYVGADTGMLSPVSVVAVDTSQMVVVTMQELYRNSLSLPGGDTISGGFKPVSLLTLNSSYSVLSRWTWLH